MNLKISNFGIDGWALGEFEWQGNFHPNDVLLTSLEHGIRLYDTAPVYGNGRSESIFGEFLEKNENSNTFFVATKAGLEKVSEGNFTPNGRPDFLREQIKLSLERLNLKTIDLVQLHTVDPAVPLQESLDALGDFVDQGYARHTGLVLKKLDGMKASELPDVDFLRVPFNFFDYLNFGDDTIKKLLNDYRVLGYDPLSGGLLTQHYAETNEEILDHEVREHHPKFTANRIKYIQCLRKIREYFLEKGLDEVHLENVALTWLRENYDFDSILVGARSSNDIAHLQLAEKLSLDSEDYRKLEQIVNNTLGTSDPPYFIQPPPALPRHSFERHILQ